MRDWVEKGTITIADLLDPLIRVVLPLEDLQNTFCIKINIIEYNNINLKIKNSENGEKNLLYIKTHQEITL